MRHQNSSCNFLLIWEYFSRYKSISSYDKTKIPLNLRRKTASYKSSQGELVFSNSLSSVFQPFTRSRRSTRYPQSVLMHMMLVLWTVFDSMWPGEDIPLFIFQFAPLVKSATAERLPMTHLATYFSKSRLMARFQSHQGVRFHIKEHVISDLEVPDDVLDLPFSFAEMDTLVRLEPSHRSRFWQICR